MTTDELRKKFSDDFGMNPWPLKYEVDAETYGNVCQDTFTFLSKKYGKWIPLVIGPNNGILFKGVELIKK